MSNDRRRESGWGCRLFITALLVSLSAGCVVEEVCPPEPIFVESPVILCKPPAAIVFESTLPPPCEEAAGPVPGTSVHEVVEVGAAPSASLSEAVFEAALAPYGEWIVVADFGRVWRPTWVEVGYRPYTRGRWVFTDCGWTFVADHAWGSIVYHYGRWSLSPFRGWIWIPDGEWAPAWVYWRACDDYVGWAPLPPASLASFSLRFSLLETHVHPSCWSFVESRHFLARRVSAVVLDVRHNASLIHRSDHLAAPTAESGLDRGRGPDVRFVERRTLERVVARSAAAVRRDADDRVLSDISTARAAAGPAGFQGSSAARTRRDEASGHSSTEASRERAAHPAPAGFRHAAASSTTVRGDARVPASEPGSKAPVRVHADRRPTSNARAHLDAKQIGRRRLDPPEKAAPKEPLRTPPARATIEPRPSTEPPRVPIPTGGIPRSASSKDKGELRAPTWIRVENGSSVRVQGVSTVAPPVRSARWTSRPSSAATSRSEASAAGGVHLKQSKSHERVDAAAGATTSRPEPPAGRTQKATRVAGPQVLKVRNSS
jgi:hypothetical protein